MKKGKKIFWGLLFLLGALALILGQMGYLGEIGFWNILISIAVIGILVNGIWNRNFGMILFAIAFLIILNDRLLGLEAITPWPVLGAALLGTIGLSILFPGKENWKHQHFGGQHGHERRSMEQNAGNSGIYAGGDTLSGEEIWFSNTFGESVKYLTGNELSQVHLKNSFGSLIVYFDNAVLKEGMGTVHVSNSFGNTVLYVPADWRVILNVDRDFGDIVEEGTGNLTGSNVLHLEGSVSFGELEIHYL